VGISAIARNALGTLRQVLVPRGLRASGLSGTAALAGYGVVSGMAMPLLLFPACLPGALAEMLLPALTRLQAAGQTDRLRARVRALLRDTFLLSLGAGAVFFLSADVLAWVLYRSAEAARYIRLLSPMVPLIYTDLVTDGCLKGLGQQVWSMGINILDALLGLLLTWQLLPRYALTAYLGIIYATEFFNFALSVGRLVRVMLFSSPRGAGGGAHLPGAGSEKCAYTAGRSAQSHKHP
jgi:stage V sporulation protein B